MIGSPWSIWCYFCLIMFKIMKKEDTVSLNLILGKIEWETTRNGAELLKDFHPQVVNLVSLGTCGDCCGPQFLVILMSLEGYSHANDTPCPQYMSRIQSFDKTPPRMPLLLTFLSCNYSQASLRHLNHPLCSILLALFPWTHLLAELPFIHSLIKIIHKICSEVLVKQYAIEIRVAWTTKTSVKVNDHKIV